jgi:hypothetical protein
VHLSKYDLFENFKFAVASINLKTTNYWWSFVFGKILVKHFSIEVINKILLDKKLVLDSNICLM